MATGTYSRASSKFENQQRGPYLDLQTDYSIYVDKQDLTHDSVPQSLPTIWISKGLQSANKHHYLWNR
jgi:hypothetical protein